MVPLLYCINYRQLTSYVRILALQHIYIYIYQTAKNPRPCYSPTTPHSKAMLQHTSTSNAPNPPPPLHSAPPPLYHTKTLQLSSSLAPTLSLPDIYMIPKSCQWPGNPVEGVTAHMSNGPGLPMIEVVEFSFHKL